MDILSQPVTSLPGIGPHRGRVLAAAGIRSILDVLWHVPRRYLDRGTIAPISTLERHVGSVVTVIGRISGVVLLRGRRARLVVTIRDDAGSMDLVFFHGVQFWQKSLAAGECIAASGEVAVYGRRLNMVHPDIDRLQDEETLTFINTGGIVPVYPSSAELERAGLTRTHGMRRLALAALEQGLPAVEDPLQPLRGTTAAAARNDGSVRDDGTAPAGDGRIDPSRHESAPGESEDPHARLRHLRDACLRLPLREAIDAMHRPPTMDALAAARRRLAFDELFLLSLQLAYQRWRTRAEAPGISFRAESPTARALVSSLPFTLTAAQKRTVREIVSDMERPEPMNRLLQGDVGSGKTVVALLAMLVAVDNGCQCALMAPTEILAEQHYRTLTTLVNDLRVSIRLLTGQHTAAQRAEVLAGAAGGTVHILVGTHALIQDDVSFHRLGLVVIDEQHRFGVRQRATLRVKGESPDALVMTATPIPRTLAMTLYGDLDVSVIDELPKGRRPIQTRIAFEEERASVHAQLRAHIADGGQAYVVFPLVSESEKLDLRAATEEYERMRDTMFPDLRVGLLHGQLRAKEKDEVMQRFVRHELDLLVSTTVIEVGVDVPNASIMVIEHAERFGLAQLHQLRGRVGRGTRQGACVLMTERRLFYAAGRVSSDEQREASDARRRLEALRDIRDGFALAEIDLDIRGPGDLWGTMQTGFPELRVASLVHDADILAAARTEAFSIVEHDPGLTAPRHDGVRRILGPRIRARLAMADIA